MLKLRGRSEEWRNEKAKLKEKYKEEVDKVRERLMENRTLEHMVNDMMQA